ncbi:MAG: hypothetical protein JW783_08070 [Bacteroidales bacterium]|nr:hypothetical protein [Bacteroidales bacterium]MBN2749896.1 hypothetical protein [Bacteroidales bacterium]
MLCLVLLVNHVLAQDRAVKRDSLQQEVREVKDSTKIYKDIETYSKRTPFTKFVYGLVFKSMETPAAKRKKRRGVNWHNQKSYSAFEGKVIRSISIETLDPFGNSIADTTKRKQNFFIKTGNKLHLKTRKITIRNLMLIKQNQPFDSLLVKESERLVRAQSYIRDVSFFVEATAQSSDSVDIHIRQLDKWSLLPDGSFSSRRFMIGFNDKNFLGLGHDFKNAYTWHRAPPDFAFNLHYYIPNIRNTFINSTIDYGTNEFGNSVKSIAIDRPFFSPFAKWAAGVTFTDEIIYSYRPNIDSTSNQYRIRFRTQDYWAGNALRIFKGNTEVSRTTNFVSAIRFFRIRYGEKPSVLVDTASMFANENLFLASIGISSRKYAQERYIFKFGITEDVPIGRVYSLTAGFRERNSNSRFYLGARASFGNFYPWGYLSSNLEYGTFFNKSKSEQATLSASINYFSGLFELKRWRIRQFIKSQATIGINRFPYDTLTLNNSFGIEGFNSTSLTGNSRIVITLQTQAYSPWSVLGFRFGPFFSCSFGMLSSAEMGFSNSKVFSHFGIGVLVKNENLIINTFQFSFSFYPTIPGAGYNILKLNSVHSTDFGFKDFEIGKPGVVIYQ